MKSQKSYRSSGVNREKADRLVDTISVLARSSYRNEVKTQVGGYASIVKIGKEQLALTTDGVGTKLKLAIELEKYSSIGIDLVAMNVNDLLCVGAEPICFLDYYATGNLNVRVSYSLLKGIVDGCKRSKMALVGGETAEMPGIYHEGDFDLAGFALGRVLHRLPRTPKPGDLIVGLRSSGFHSNGFSLIRSLLPAQGAFRKKVLKKLLTPTRIYTPSLLPLFQKKKWASGILGIAHITGSGFLNVPRISDKVDYSICLPPMLQLPWEVRWIMERSKLSLLELSQTFNLGIGMVLVIKPSHSNQILASLRRSGEDPILLGKIQKRQAAFSQVHLHTDHLGEVSLRY